MPTCGSAAFGVLAVSGAVGAGLVGWACLRTDAFAAICVPAREPSA